MDERLASAEALWEPKVCEQVPDVSDRTLRWALVVGLNCLALPGHLADPVGRGYWTSESCRALAERIRGVGLQIGTLILHNVSRQIVLGHPGRDEHLERVVRSIQAAGSIGCPVVEYSLAPQAPLRGIRRWLSLGEPMPRNWHEVLRWLKGHPLVSVAVENPEPRDAWEPLEYFLWVVAPAAEEAGVSLALHLDDSLAPTAPGPGQVLERLAWLRRLRDLVPSKAHGVTFCQDALARRGIDLVEAAYFLGRRERIHHLHYRIPRSPPPLDGERWHDGADVQMLLALKACRDVGYKGAVCPCRRFDPDAALPVDLVDRARAHGYIRALVQVARRLR